MVALFPAAAVTRGEVAGILRRSYIDTARGSFYILAESDRFPAREGQLCQPGKGAKPRDHVAWSAGLPKLDVTESSGFFLLAHSAESDKGGA